MDADFRAHFQKPQNYKEPPAQELRSKTIHPNLNSVDYRSRVQETDQPQLLPFYETLTTNSDQSTVLLSTNSYTSRLWNGSIFGYEQFDDVGKTDAAKLKLSIDSNVKGVQFASKQIIIFGTACGSLQLWSTQSEIRQKSGYSLYKISAKSEHSGYIDALDLLGGDVKNKAITGSSDGCIKIWDIITDLVSENVYRYAHCGIIKGISSKPGSDFIFASCSQDRLLSIWDKRTKKPVIAFCENPRVENTTCLWQKINGKEFIHLGDASGDVHIYDPRKFNETLATKHMFDSPIHKFKTSPNGSVVSILGQSETLKLCTNDTNLTILHENSPSTDFVRDICWSNKVNQQNIFYTVGWGRSIERNTFENVH